MKKENITLHIATGEEGNSFVGIKIIGNHINFYYPESYHIDKENYKRNDFIDLLNTISLAKKHSKECLDANNKHNIGDEHALLSYIWIIEDYLNNGLYISNEKVFKANQGGRINWKRTLRQQPIVSNNRIIYKDYIAEVKSQQETVLTEAYRYCLKKSVMLIGWIYGLFQDCKKELKVEKGKELLYLNAINKEQSSIFNDEKHTRLNHMEKIIIGLDEIVDDNRIVYGVDNYNYVFEKMIDCIFGNENTSDYYPSFFWKLKYSKKKQAGPTIRPDTIMKHKSGDSTVESIYIIDSKYYRFGSLDWTNTKGLPEASSIIKQITYGKYVKSINPDKDVYNVFILPYDANGPEAVRYKKDNTQLEYIGAVLSDWEGKETYGKIHTFLIDLKYVVRTWNHILHDGDRELLVEEINKEVANKQKCIPSIYYNTF